MIMIFLFVKVKYSEKGLVGDCLVVGNKINFYFCIKGIYNVRINQEGVQYGPN